MSATSSVSNKMAFMPLTELSRIAVFIKGPKGATEQFQLAATAQNLRKLAKLVPTVVPT
jgi:hypothetical protein